MLVLLVCCHAAIAVNSNPGQWCCRVSRQVVSRFKLYRHNVENMSSDFSTYLENRDICVFQCDLGPATLGLRVNTMPI